MVTSRPVFVGAQLSKAASGVTDPVAYITYARSFTFSFIHNYTSPRSDRPMVTIWKLYSQFVVTILN